MDFKDLKNKLKKSLSSGSFWTLSGFILVLALSWFYFSKLSLNNEEERIHSLLQSEFQTLISDFVVKKHPEVDEITFHEVWTKQTEDPQTVRIFFSYSLQTKGAAGGELLIEGTALLIQMNEEFWTVQDFQVTDSLVEFSEPLMIKAKSSSESQ